MKDATDSATGKRCLDDMATASNSLFTESALSLSGKSLVVPTELLSR